MPSRSCRDIVLFVKQSEHDTGFPFRGEGVDQCGGCGSGNDVSVGVDMAAERRKIIFAVGEFSYDQIHMIEACLMDGSADHVGVGRIPEAFFHGEEHDIRHEPLGLKEGFFPGFREEMAVSGCGGDQP